ncbi:MAG: AI-2E family transporter [Gammaproteobacteria bacterium]|nr:AI-2E family transporter [Gammaproteobacteria bacterium]
MPESTHLQSNTDFTQNTIEVAIRLGLLFLLAAWCFRIIYPFIEVVMWGVIIAVATYPLFIKLRSAMGHRNKLAAIVYTLLALALLITPAMMIADSLIQTSQVLSERYEQGQLEIPPPQDNVKQWPLVGEKLYDFWSQASTNLQGTIEKYEPQLKEGAEKVITVAAGTGGGILQFILSIIIAGVLVANAQGAYNVTLKTFSRLIDNRQGEMFTNLSRDTIRSIAQGVIGIAIIQALLSGLGMYVMNIPAWGLWSLFILVLAIAQLPPILVLGFVIAYVWTVAETTPAVIFTIYALIVSGSDSFLKPLLLGRGLKTPMLVILLGAIGGMLMSGIIGLFIGAVILALGYELFMEWLDRGAAEAKSQAA